MRQLDEVLGRRPLRPDGAQLDLPVVLADKLSEVDSVLLTGDGARRFFAGRGFDIAPEEFDHPSAAVLAEMARTRLGQTPEEVQPLYLRGADVRIGWEERHS